MTRRGFTLIELMMAIVILAVLATVATTSYIRYMRRAKTQEAIATLGDIRIRQELYYQANSRYACSGDNCACTFFPTTPDPTDSGTDLPAAPAYVSCEAANTNPRQAWCELGLDPNGDFLFKTAFVGWDGTSNPKVNCDGVTTCNSPTDTGCWALDTTRPWWFAVSHGNLDGDTRGICSTFYISSATKTVLMENEIE